MTLQDELWSDWGPKIWILKIIASQLRDLSAILHCPVYYSRKPCLGQRFIKPITGYPFSFAIWWDCSQNRPQTKDFSHFEVKKDFLDCRTNSAALGPYGQQKGGISVRATLSSWLLRSLTSFPWVPDREAAHPDSTVSYAWYTIPAVDDLHLRCCAVVTVRRLVKRCTHDWCTMRRMRVDEVRKLRTEEYWWKKERQKGWKRSNK